jgi:glycolate oxidase iron-sulfur subunit
VLKLDGRTYARAQDCVHCGLCLTACPTYLVTGSEADSPRGRIHLIKGLADGRIAPTPAVLKHLDLCLDCRACETACPSDVVYHELIEEARARFAEAGSPPPMDALTRTVVFHLLPYPIRLKLALWPARLLQRVRVWEPLVRGLAAMKISRGLCNLSRLVPWRGRLWEPALAEHHHPAKPTAGSGIATKIGFFTGCVSSVLYGGVNRQAVQLLQLASCRVWAPRPQCCCGAIHHHSGQVEQARRFARANIDAFQRGAGPHRCDRIVSTVAGCGAMLKEYPHLLRDDPAYAPRAEAFAACVRDISELLVELAPPPPQRPLPATVTYHDACHLAHAQRVTEAPRKLLSWIPGLRVVPLVESTVCCGAAGTYSLQQPHMATTLAQRKLQHLLDTGADTCVTGNVGCAMQIQAEADRQGSSLRVVHPVTLLHEAYFGPPLTTRSKMIP